MPTTAFSEVSSSFQKSASLVVVTWLPSIACAVPAVAPPAALAVIEPEVTRVSLRPVRRAAG